MDEELSPLPSSKLAASAPSATGKNADINTATLDELIELPGIGEATAAKILLYREQNGPFQDIEQIMDVPGIGEGKFEGLKELITVGP